MDKTLGLYIHIPFCLAKCPYCDFYSVKCGRDDAKAYADAVCRSIANSGLKGRRVNTVYFGGGTPVLLGAKNLAKILDFSANYFCFSGPEITIEANPAAALGQGIADFRAAGFNRISFGVQSGADAELKALGRLHTAKEAENCVYEAYKAGFDNISADLMLGIPHQNIGSLKESIDFLISMPLSHISAYMLKIEEGTPFAMQNAADLCPGEDNLAEMYLYCVDYLEQNSFAQYEISNFAKNGAISRHNMKYWRLEKYFGIGPSAHSFIDNTRFYMPHDINAFISAENPLSLKICDGDGGGFDEYSMLRLRLREGLDLKRAAELYGADTSHIAEKARSLEQNRLVTFKNGVVSLTPEGFLLSNSVTASLLYQPLKIQ